MRTAPGPSVVEMMRTWRRRLLGRDRLSAILELFRTYGPIVKFGFPGFHWFMVSDPDAARYVLVENHHNYAKSRRYDVMKPVLGNGLVTAEGDLWKRQRKLVAPVFHHGSIARFDAVMAQEIDGLCARLATYERRSINLTAELSRVTFQIAGRAFFGEDLGARSEEFGSALAYLHTDAERRLAYLISPPDWLPLPANRGRQHALSKMDAIVQDIIRARAGRPPARDLLGLLLSARDDSGQGMSDQQVRDEVMTMLVGGHETTAGALKWTFLRLSQHPDLARQLEAELDEALAGRPARGEDLPKLPRLRRFVQETLRLHPPIWVVERRANQEDQLNGYHVPAGSTVVLALYALHRNPAHWVNPEGFDPERFQPEAVAARHRAAYLPFVAGPRGCIGEHMGMMEVMMTVATVMQRYRLPLVPGQDAEAYPTLTLRPRHQTWVTVTPRAGSAANGRPRLALL